MRACAMNSPPDHLTCSYPNCTEMCTHSCNGLDGVPNGVHLCPTHTVLYGNALDRLPLAINELHALTALMPDSYKVLDMGALPATFPASDIRYDVFRALARVRALRGILSNCGDKL